MIGTIHFLLLTVYARRIEKKKKEHIVTNIIFINVQRRDGKEYIAITVY